MKHAQAKARTPSQEELHRNTDADYAPKTYSLRQQLATALKTLAVAGAIGMLLWVFDALTS